MEKIKIEWKKTSQDKFQIEWTIESNNRRGGVPQSLGFVGIIPIPNLLEI